MRTHGGCRYWKISVIPGYYCSSNLGSMKSRVNVVCLYGTSQHCYCYSPLGTKGNLERFQAIYKLEKFHKILETAEEATSEIEFYQAQTLGFTPRF